ncbi:TauD/TfdA family dioxygenase [Paenibacillus sp. DR312]|uniref:TauD/TfdA family dioxygenase n=1 Tax=unclassified Paenibacillus TaxID=185978 RepID=UPI001C978541|nr:TauD/TfdA family dioxygenase [Paenibacillus sp. DR312]QZN76191.1 TauD/TfdA family dioxygenase [Paenibacillus sp. DR312]
MVEISMKELQEEGFIKLNIPGLNEKNLIAISEQIGIPVNTRLGANVIDNLTPIEKKDANKNSLSGNHGFNSFPLHTDTAYFKIPARYILLYSVHPGSGGRPTLLYDANRFFNYDKVLRSELSNVLFKVVNGRYSFLTTIYNYYRSNYYFRLDRDCMKATSSVGSELLTKIDSIIYTKDLNEVIWNCGDLLIFDNWRFLHGRGQSNVIDNDRLLLRISIKER